MKKTFREKAISKFNGIIKRNRLLKYPCLIAMSVIMTAYYICLHFSTNVKRYACIAFSLIFFMSSCSFSFAVLSGQRSAAAAQDAYSAVMADSDAELAVEKPVVPDGGLMPDEGSVTDGFGHEEGLDDADFYTLDDILEDTQSYGLEDGYEDGAQQGAADARELAFDSGDWRITLINKQHPIADDYSFSLGSIAANMRCDKRIIADAISMLQAAKNEGITLKICSPYRTEDRQEYLFNKKINDCMRQGYSYMDAYKTVSQVVTVPGASEHQVGLALDIASDVYPWLEQEFGSTEAGKWLAEHSYEYGFVVRYPSGKEHITGIEYEPWHFRYVGKDAAAIMKQDAICLEEFWDKYL